MKNQHCGENSSEHRLRARDIRTQSQYDTNKKFLLMMATGNLMRMPPVNKASSCRFLYEELRAIK